MLSLDGAAWADRRERRDYCAIILKEETSTAALSVLWGGEEMAGYLIKDTTKEERERIVAESIGNINGACDGCAAMG